MLAFPFVPMIVIFVPIVSYLSFKLEVHNTLKHRCKPKRPWKAQKAGSVFSLLYLISTVFVGIPMVIFFLASHTFPKNCDIQDNNVGLCRSDINAKNICMTDVTSPYYYLYGGEGIRGTLSDYPSMICKQACGMYTFFFQQSCNLPLVASFQSIFSLTHSLHLSPSHTIYRSICWCFIICHYTLSSIYWILIYFGRHMASSVQLSLHSMVDYFDIFCRFTSQREHRQCI